MAFALLGALLLFSNFSSYLVQARLTALADRAESIAKTTALEIQRAGSRDLSGIAQQREAAAAREFEGASLSVVRMTRPCNRTSSVDRQQPAADRRASTERPLAAAGPWVHVDPPAEVPDWIGCDGFKGLLALASSDKAAGATAPPPPPGPRCRSTAARFRSTTRRRPRIC